MLAQSQGLIKPQISSDFTRGLIPVRPAKVRSVLKTIGSASFEFPLHPLFVGALLVSGTNPLKVTEQHTENWRTSPA